GHANPEGSRFCSNCGNPLTAEGAAAGHPETPAEKTSTLSLASLEGGVTETGEERAGDLTSADQAAVESLPPGTALLVVRRGPNAGSRFLLDADVTTAGRHPEGDIFLDDVTVSRRHAEFCRGVQGFLVRDVGSLNGTYVNRERIDSVLLAPGDE